MNITIAELAVMAMTDMSIMVMNMHEGYLNKV